MFTVYGFDYSVQIRASWHTAASDPHFGGIKFESLPSGIIPNQTFMSGSILTYIFSSLCLQVAVLPLEIGDNPYPSRSLPAILKELNLLCLKPCLFCLHDLKIPLESTASRKIFQWSKQVAVTWGGWCKTPKELFYFSRKFTVRWGTRGRSLSRSEMMFPDRRRGRFLLIFYFNVAGSEWCKSSWF
jgi:hypothetical protein